VLGLNTGDPSRRGWDRMREALGISREPAHSIVGRAIETVDAALTTSR
jgi:hypothetical protein